MLINRITLEPAITKTIFSTVVMKNGSNVINTRKSKYIWRGNEGTRDLEARWGLSKVKDIVLDLYYEVQKEATISIHAIPKGISLNTYHITTSYKGFSF